MKLLPWFYLIFTILLCSVNGKPFDKLVYKTAKEGEYCGPVENPENPGYVGFIIDCVDDSLICTSYTVNGVCEKIENYSEYGESSSTRGRNDVYKK